MVISFWQPVAISSRVRFTVTWRSLPRAVLLPCDLEPRPLNMLNRSSNPKPPLKLPPKADLNRSLRSKPPKSGASAPWVPAKPNWS